MRFGATSLVAVAYFLPTSALLVMFWLPLGTKIKELVLFFALEIFGMFVLGLRCALSPIATELYLWCCCLRTIVLVLLPAVIRLASRTFGFFETGWVISDPIFVLVLALKVIGGA